MLTGPRPRRHGPQPTPADKQPVVDRALLLARLLRFLRERARVPRLALTPYGIRPPALHKLETGQTVVAVHHLDAYAAEIRGRSPAIQNAADILCHLERCAEECAARGFAVAWAPSPPMPPTLGMTMVDSVIGNALANWRARPPEDSRPEPA